MYLELGLCILRVVNHLLTNIISRYKDLRNHKAAKNTVISDPLHKVNSSITHLHDKSSEFIENSIHCNSGISYLSNITATSDSSLFITTTTLSYNSKSTSNQQVYLLFFGDLNYKRMISSIETHLTVAISYLVIS